VTADDRDLTPPNWRLEPPPMLTRAQAAQLCQVSEAIRDPWSYEPGFPVIRRNGGRRPVTLRGGEYDKPSMRTPVGALHSTCKNGRGARLRLLLI
jgi:hypothetical protein